MTDLQWARISGDAFNLALFSYLAAMVGYFAFLAFRRDGLWKVSRAVAFVGLGANVVSIVARGFAAHRVPWGNMYEYSTLLALLVVAGYLLIVEGMYKIRTLGGFALMFSVLTMAVAVTFLYVGPGPLVPALNSYWIKIHVQAAIWGSSLFALGGSSRSCTWHRTGVSGDRPSGCGPRSLGRSWVERSTWTPRPTSTPMSTTSAVRRPLRERAGSRRRRHWTGSLTASSRSRSPSGRSR